MEKTARLLATIYLPMMWVLVVLNGGLGLLGILAPARLRGVARVFTGNRTVRILGVFLMVFGAEMFIRGSGAELPWLVKSLGVILFMFGGVCLFIPTLSVILAEWCVARSDNWYRVLGLACLGLAYLFYHATRLPLLHAAEGLNLHYGP
jgi:hypothetical protein